MRALAAAIRTIVAASTLVAAMASSADAQDCNTCYASCETQYRDCWFEGYNDCFEGCSAQFGSDADRWHPCFAQCTDRVRQWCGQALENCNYYSCRYCSGDCGSWCLSDSDCDSGRCSWSTGCLCS